MTRRDREPRGLRAVARVESPAWSDEATRGYLPRLMREAREAEQAAHEARARLTRAAARLRERGRA